MSFRIKIFIYVFFGAIVVLALLFATGVISPFQDQGISGSVVVWDVKNGNQGVFQSFFSEYNRRFPGISVKYEVKNSETYIADLLDAMASGKGPDIFTLDSSELLKQRNKISPLSQGDALAAEFLASAPDAVLAGLTDSAGNIYGMPFSLDNLALYYNKDHLNAANIASPPKTWQEFQDFSRRLTRRSPTGVIQRSGASFGLGKNVDYAPDIFYTLMFQSGNEIFSQKDGRFHLADSVLIGGETTSPGVSALTFYTDFANPNSPYYTWNSTMPEARSAFAQGRAAFYIGYARDFQPILAENPHLNFSVAPLPQLEISQRISFASYRIFTVSKFSASPSVAWTVVSSIFQPTVAKPIIDSLGLPPAHRDLISGTPPNKLFQPFYDQVLSARSWPIQDAAVTSRIVRNAMDAVINGSMRAREALNQMQSQLQSLVDSNLTR